MADFLDVCEQAARIGGAVLLDWRHRIAAREKGPRDLVTEADLASQQAIRRYVLDQFPDHGFLGEESTEEDDGSADSYRWVVDPLDGTVNYVHGLPSYAVSVALEHQGEMVAGVVYDPLADECYRASLGGGASLNGQPIAPSGCVDLTQALVAASFSANVQRESRDIARFIEVLLAAQSIRRLGSAALNLCYVASGRLDGYWASSVKIWDVAAAVLILREAGGAITGLGGEPFRFAEPELAAAATGELQQRLVGALQRA